jgi:hypothetical protein
MRRFRLLVSLTGFVMLAAVLVAPVRGQHRGSFRAGAAHGAGQGFAMAGMGMHGGCQNGGGGQGFPMQTPFGQGGGMQNPLARGNGMLNPFGQSANLQNLFGQNPGMMNSLNQANTMQNPFGQAAAVQQMQNQLAMMQQIIYNENMMLQYYQQLLSQMQNGQSTAQNGTTQAAATPIAQMPSFYSPTTSTSSSNPSYRSASVRAR